MKQVLDFIKANVVALMCGVIALLAIIAVFVWPVPGMFADLTQQVTDRKKTYDEITTLSSAPRTLPNVDPGNAEPAPLTAFPTRSVITEGQRAMEQVKVQSKNVLKTVIDRNAREPLVPDALPNPQSLARNNFFNAYRVATAQYGENAERGIVRSVLKGTLPPTQEELNAVEAARANAIRKEILQTDDRGVAQNQPQVDARIAEMKSKLGMEERVRRAENYQIYVSPTAVEIHPAMATVSDLTAISIFNAQFSLWLQTTVLEAVAEANKGSKNVLDAPIKHLVLLRVPMNIADPNAIGVAGGMAMGMGMGGPPEGMGGMGGMGGGDPAAAAAPAAAVDLKPDPTVALTPSYGRNPLGYASNAMYDPINFHMTLRIDATRLSEALAALSRRHLIKIRNVSSIRPVDTGLALSQGYFYSREGKLPLVEVDLDCDVLILREWLVRYMPDPVKTVFTTLATPAAAAPAAE